jgi:hypothetical protein
VKKLALVAVLLLALPALATIAQQRNASNWTCSGTTNTTTGQISCSANFATTGANDLILVWATWQSSATLTATVTDSLSPAYAYVSAVGPTVQSASSTPTSAQLFYAKNIVGSSVTNAVKVTLQGPIPGGTSVPSFSVVIVEYSGLDQSYPLDSASAAYSNNGNATQTFDSGAVAPANGNILVFGAGTSDAGTASANSAFTLVQRSGGSVTEEAIVQTGTSLPQGNVSLQRAVGHLSASGNWLEHHTVGNGAGFHRYDEHWWDVHTRRE